jgi:hypothetical protein
MQYHHCLNYFHHHYKTTVYQKKPEVDYKCQSSVLHPNIPPENATLLMKKIYHHHPNFVETTTTQKKMTKMADIINDLQENLIIKGETADELHTTFDKLQLSIFYNTKNNNSTSPCGRRYTDDVKEFALTFNYYSPKAYQYVRSIIPLPNPSLIRKWSS